MNEMDMVDRIARQQSFFDKGYKGKMFLRYFFNGLFTGDEITIPEEQISDHIMNMMYLSWSVVEMKQRLDTVPVPEDEHKQEHLDMVSEINYAYYWIESNAFKDTLDGLLFLKANNCREKIPKIYNIVYTLVRNEWIAAFCAGCGVPPHTPARGEPRTPATAV